MKYITVKVPEPLIEGIEKIIEDRPDLSYRNRSEFVIESARAKYLELKEGKKLTKIDVDRLMSLIQWWQEVGEEATGKEPVEMDITYLLELIGSCDASIEPFSSKEE